MIFWDSEEYEVIFYKDKTIISDLRKFWQGAEIRHKDGNPRNNDSDNIEIVRKKNI